MRVKGARDKKKRKTRSDKKRKYRKKYGKLVLYVPKRKRGDSISVWFWERKPMSFDGYKRWNKKLRLKIKKVITKFVDKPILVDPYDLSSVEKIEELAVEVIQYPGMFLLMMPTHSKNTHHVSYKKKAVIKIVETEEGLRAKLLDYFNLSRYWFFSGR